MSDPDDPISELITSYNELNSNVIQELSSEPSPLEFQRHVARNTPFVVRGAASSWKASMLWSAAYLKEALAAQTVNIAVTPQGNADSPVRLTSGEIVFAKPLEEDQDFGEFLDYLIQQEKGQLRTESEVRYAQTQNDNFRNEYLTLFSHVPKDIPFARIALEQDPDAINLWVGNGRSVTALHKDNYENIYVQILGRKHFVLLPSLCQPCVNEKALPPATYARAAANSGLELRMDDDGAADETVPFAIWDPDRPDVDATPYSPLADPVRVTLNPGDMLYLPAMWYHKVSQSTDSECEDDICVAVNYWYDMEFSGALYPLSSFVRSVYQHSRNASLNNQTQ